MTRAEKSVKFLTEEVPLLLNHLKPDTTPLWGSMTPQQMVEHLQFSLAVTTGAKIMKVITPWYMQPFLKFFILSNRPIPKNIKFPGNKEGKLPPLKYASLEEAKAQLIRAIEDTIYFMRKSPEVKTSHPLGGVFTPDNWRIFHYKHFTHHLRQFGLLPPS